MVVKFPVVALPVVPLLGAAAQSVVAVLDLLVEVVFAVDMAALEAIVAAGLKTFVPVVIVLAAFVPVVVCLAVVVAVLLDLVPSALAVVAKCAVA